jgi:hypothetical protein
MEAIAVRNIQDTEDKLIKLVLNPVDYPRDFFFGKNNTNEIKRCVKSGKITKKSG